MTRDSRLAVYYTVDTEVWWSRPDLGALAHDVRRWFHGATPRGDYGVPFQLRVLSDHGLRGSFFVESLMGSVVGPGPVEEMVGTVLDAGQDVQLHAHVEWLRLRPHAVVRPDSGDHLRSFGLNEQTVLLKEAAEGLVAAGAPWPTAFRAGTFGADTATLEALARVGIGIDTSLDRCYLDDDCRIEGGAAVRQPQRLGPTLEVPVTAFEDWPGHLRPAHLNACSFEEMRHALEEARRLGHTTFVIVSHSFELLNDRRERLNPIVLRRFERLCRFLADHSDDFRTADFRSPVPEPGAPVPEIRGRLGHTVGRMAGQAWSRLAHR